MVSIDLETEKAALLFSAKIKAHFKLIGLILFGSHARKTNHLYSDVDIAVLLHGHHEHFVETKLEMADIAYDVLLETGVLIQPLPIWEDEWEHPERYVNPALLKNIDREGIRL